MGKEAKILIAVAAVVAVGVSALIIAGSTSKSTPKAGGDKLVRADSYQTNKGASVTVVEFGDYQCPACGAAEPTVESIKQEYGSKINFVFRNLPLTQLHKNALAGANAAEAAGSQGKYYEMNQLLYQKQKEWSEAANPINFFVTYAGQLGLDANKLKSEVENQSYKEKIERDLKDAESLGLNATPSFFVNGKPVENVGQLKAAIEAALKTAAPAPAG
jgi:protein-disulfide isomerase